MKSGYLRELSEFFAGYDRLLIYGAGGVTRDFLKLFSQCLCKEKTHIVVSQKKDGDGVLEGYSVQEISEFCAARERTFVVISAMPRYVPQIEVRLKESGFPDYCTVTELIERLYGEIWTAPVQKNKILLANGDGCGFGGNPKYIAQELMKRGEKTELVWVLGEGVEGRLPEGIRAVRYGTCEHYRELGTARVWIDNQHKNYFTRKREGQTYIQTWHGGGPLKKIEFDAEGLSKSYLDLCELNSGMEDIMVSPSKFNSLLYEKAFHYSGEIMECGYPRNDLFWKENGCREKITALFGTGLDDGILLYAPTYREFPVEAEDILDLDGARKALEKKFRKKFRIFVRFHPFDREPEKKYGQCGEWVNVTAYPDVQELLAAADILITDYSSIMWDFSLQKKPVFLFHPDLLRYRRERGYYLPFEKMPYREAVDNREMIRRIEEFDQDRYRNEMTAFLAEYGSFDNGTASGKIADRILEIIKGQGEPQ